jgi:electron transfer flavoprotein alpha/beta subunit
VKIVVCLHAPRGRGDAPPPVLGTDDAYALGLALAFGAPHTVTALLAGPPIDAAPLERALAAGAARAVRLVGEDFGSADFHTLGQALGTAIKRLGGTLVLTGARSDDDGLGAVAASIARQVNALHVACIEELSPAGEDAVEITVRGGGRRRRLRVPLPAVLSVVASGPEAPDLPTIEGKGKGEVERPAIEILSLVDPEATVVRRRTELLGQPELPQRTTEEAASAEALVDRLAR